MKFLIWGLRAVLALLLLSSQFAHAHKASDSYLSIRTEGQSFAGQWDIALRDLEFAIGLDRDGNGELTWEEVRSKHPDIAAYALSRLELSASGSTCHARVTEHLIDRHSDGAYAAMRFAGDCPAPIDNFQVHYQLLFDLDQQHRGLLRLETDNQTVTAIFSPQHSKQQFSSVHVGVVSQFTDYLVHGAWHIWIGFDHILFLVSLLLPAVLVLKDRRWISSDSFRRSFVDVLKIVTAFTVSHSITLSIASLGILQLPSRWVETAIAASVIVASLNNLFPFFQGRRWLVAFGFGLIHGFGFATVLSELGLPASALVTALLGFNVGVELGQIAIVLAFLPVAYLLRQTWLYHKLVFRAGSAVIAGVAAVWLVERAFEVSLIPV